MENKQKIIDSLDTEYIKETLQLLHAAVNRKEGHNDALYNRFLKSIKILDSEDTIYA